MCARDKASSPQLQTPNKSKPNDRTTSTTQARITMRTLLHLTTVKGHTSSQITTITTQEHHTEQRIHTRPTRATHGISLILALARLRRRCANCLSDGLEHEIVSRFDQIDAASQAPKPHLRSATYRQGRRRYETSSATLQTREPTVDGGWCEYEVGARRRMRRCT